MRTYQIVLVLILGTFLVGCAGKRYPTVPLPPTPKSVNLVDAQDPECPGMLINPYHVRDGARSFQSHVCFQVKNPKEGVLTDIFMSSGSRPDSWRLWKGGPRIKIHGNRQVVENMCVGKTIFICESRSGGNVSVQLKADGEIGTTSYSDESDRVSLRAVSGYYGGWQQNKINIWIINFRQDPLINPPNKYYDSSGRTYVDQNGVIRAR